MPTYVNGVLQIASDVDALHAPRITTGHIMFAPWISTQATTAHTADRLVSTLIHVPRNLTISSMKFHVTAGNVADYTTGTAAFTNGSDQVVGTLTVFASTHVGSRIKNDADAVWHTILSVEDATHLTLTANYSSTGGAAAAYTINHTARVGLYTADSALLGTGSVLLSDMGIADISTTGIKTITKTVSLAKGYYWASLHCGVNPTVATFASFWHPMGMATSSYNTAGYVSVYTNSVTYGALPSTLPASTGDWITGYYMPMIITSLD